MGTLDEPQIVSIEQGDRLVVLARTLDARSTEARETLEKAASEWRGFGETYLGRALYRHHSIFKSQSDALVWSHAEFVYFRDIVPSQVVDQLVHAPQPPGVNLLRAEILVTTPASFVFPRDWSGSSHRSGRKPSIEYLDVDPSYLRDYREIMRRFIGPAASKLVALGKLGTFRSMETAAVLFQAPSLVARWNQIHRARWMPRASRASDRSWMRLSARSRRVEGLSTFSRGWTGCGAFPAGPSTIRYWKPTLLSANGALPGRPSNPKGDGARVWRSPPVATM